MYKFTFILGLVLLTVIKSEGQQQTTKAQEPPKKANKIIVLVRDSANNFLDRIASILYDKGYTIENKDEKVKFISTKERQGEKWSTYYKVRARINDTAIVFTGQIALNKNGDYWDIDYRGSKVSALREAWNELDAIARKFGNNIVYSK
jgi:hypothetical protein